MKEQNLPLSVCQNSHLTNQQIQEISIKDLILDFNKNKLQDCVIFAGLEPMLQFDEILKFIIEFRKTNKEDIIIYTGYTELEIQDKIETLKQFDNIYLIVGRYKKDLPKIYDKVLKVELISNNQYGIKIS